MAMERTYIMLKPDCVKRGLMGEVISRIERKNYKIIDAKMMMLDEPILREHYAHIADKPFFPEIVTYMTSGPVLAMIVEGDNAVKGMRIIMAPPSLRKRLPVLSAATMPAAPAKTSSTAPTRSKTPRSRSSASSVKIKMTGRRYPHRVPAFFTVQCKSPHPRKGEGFHVRPYFFSAFRASIIMGTTLKRSPQMP